MPDYHASFRILGEVTGMLYSKDPTERLLIDISARPDPKQELPDFVYRTSFSATEAGLIDSLREQVTPGDVIEASGTFWQTGYVPHRNGHIDTTFRLSGFQLIEKKPSPSLRFHPYQSLFPNLNVH